MSIRSFGMSPARSHGDPQCLVSRSVRRSRTRNVLTTGGAVLVAAAMFGCSPRESEPTPSAPAIPSGSASPTADAADAVPLSQFSAGTPLDPGRYVLPVVDAPSAPLLPVLSVPEGFGALGDASETISVGSPDYGHYVWVWEVNSVSTHPCESGAGPQPVGPSVADLANALATPSLRTATDPVPVTVGGYDGLYVELSVPDDIDVAACPGGVFPMWQGRWQEYPGQVDMVWIVDVEGQRVVFDASHMADASPEQVNQLKDMVTTATFAPARG